MKNRVFLLLTSLVLTLATPTLQAAIIQVEIKATITDIRDDANILGGNVSIGDEITGWYAYNAPIDPSEVFENAAWYIFESTPYGIFLDVRNYNFETDINNVHLVVGVHNNNHGLDIFSLSSTNNISVSGMPINSINWQLDDYTMLALDNCELPIDAPTLTDWQSNYLLIDGTRYVGTTKQSLVINAVVTSAVIPEPMTLLLLAVGSMVIRFRKK